MKLIKHRRNMYTYHIKEMLFVNNCRKTVIKIGIFVIFIFFGVVILLIAHFLTSTKQLMPHRHARFATDLKYILFWNPSKKSKRFFFTKDSEYAPGQSLFIKQNCQFINCYITYNKSLLEDEQDFDAVVFHVYDVKKIVKYDLNLTRSPYQKYIFKSLEPAEKHPICNSFFDSFFNWTWTYKLNSDIPHPLINIYDDKNKLVGPKGNVDWIKTMKRTNRLKNKINSKDKAVAWIVNKCKSRSEHQNFIKELRNELKGYNYSIDIYGPCAENKCPDGRISKCFKMLDREYFFQLVLEDSFTEDYVSEKVTKAMTHISVPIVSGGADYARFLPPGSYINAQSFNLKQLGAVIDYLIKNPRKYELFFDWKHHYYYTVRPRSYICDLCTQLNKNMSLIQKSYKNFRHWWNPNFKETCERIHLLNVFKSLE